MIKTILFIAINVSTSMANAQLVTDNLPPINYVHRQAAVYAFQAAHQRACVLAPAVCNLPTLQIDTPGFNNVSESIMDGIDTALVALLPPRSKETQLKASELRNLRTSIAVQDYLFSLSFLNVYAK